MAGGSRRRSCGEGLGMNTGRTLFAQLMDFLPWSSFDRVVARYDGNRAVRKLSCAAQYQIMAFAQLTYRESLRDIEACLSARASKLYHMGLRDPVRRSTLADANESRDWRIYAEFAQRLIAQANNHSQPALQRLPWRVCGLRLPDRQSTLRAHQPAIGLFLRCRLVEM